MQSEVLPPYEDQHEVIPEPAGGTQVGPAGGTQVEPAGWTQVGPAPQSELEQLTHCSEPEVMETEPPAAPSEPLGKCNVTHSCAIIIF